MSNVFDIYTIIFLALAVFIFLRLRSVLGQRTGRERPPYDPYSARDVVRSPATDKVVTLPPAAPAETPPRPAEPAPAAGERWKGIAESGSAVAAGLDAIAAADANFDAQHFITGARAAYEMIVTTFAEGDRRQLRNLLSREVFDGFDAAITERENRGETAETRFVSIDGSTITAAELRKRTAQITVRFISKLVSVDARPQRHRDRRQRREGHRRHRRVDVRARRHLARSQLESGRDGSRTITPMAVYCRVLCSLVLLIGFAGQSLAARAAETEPIKFPDTQYEPVEWADVDGWANDDHAAAFSTFLASCRVLTITRQRSGRDAGPVGDALKEICARALAAIPLDDNGAKKFFEDNFRPLRINKLGDTDRLSHRLLRAHHRRLARADGSVHGAALSPAAQSRRRRAAQARRRFPVEGRQSRPPRRPPQDRAVLRPRRDRGWRARRLAPGNLLAARSGRRVVRADPRLGADQAGGRHHPARQLQFP